ncbi:hypothetical protein, partial [Chryseobacterium sp. CH1]|uniref:hypothetical protein n=1 Tax=Chryseobacterium sp. CH1 TaxID=713551 RepID=UPI0013E988D5
MNNQYFLNWAFEYLVLNPTVKWQDFYNEYLATERLIGLNEWYVKANSNPEASEMNNQYFLNWAFEYLVLNPTVKWQDF